MDDDAVLGHRPQPWVVRRRVWRGTRRSRCICIHRRDGKRLLRVLEHPRCPDHGRGGEWRCVGTPDG